MGKIQLSLLLWVCLTAADLRSNWVTDFSHRCFIQNNGQCSALSFNGEDGILFTTTADGLIYYFARDHVTIKKISVSEKEERNGNDVDEHSSSSRTSSVMLRWGGSSEQTEIIGINEVPYVFNYGIIENAQHNTITAPGYERIFYKNLYPGIDMEFYFSADRSGIKYNYIVHQGSDFQNIRWEYSGADTAYVDSAGNIRVRRDSLDIIDHIGRAILRTSQIPIDLSIHSAGTQFLFKGESSKQPDELIIDPWITNPGFNGYNAGYDISYDNSGNVFAYGGQGDGAPFEEMRFDSSGNLLWVYSTVILGDDGTGGSYYGYGDFLVNAQNGISYITEGFDFYLGPLVLEINSTGSLSNQICVGNNVNELWRISLDYCSNTLIIGGAHAANGPYDQMITLNTSFGGITYNNILGTSEHTHDVALLCHDKSGNCFFAYAQSSNYSTWNNVMMKGDAANILPIAFTVPDLHSFYESSIHYVNNGTNVVANGFNGMAASQKYVYTYDGATLRQWDKNSGGLVRSTTLSSLPFRWGGIGVTDCDDIYVGCNTNIIHLNSSLTQIETFPAPDKVFDVQVHSGHFYACGIGFVMSETTDYPTLDVITNQLPSTTCVSCDGTASVVGFTCNADTSDFSATWNTNPIQSGFRATGLCPGVYQVTLSNCVDTYTASVTVEESRNFSAGTDVTISPIDSVMLVPYGGISYSWSPSSGLDCSTCPNPWASPTQTTTYTVIIIDSDSCVHIDSVTVYVDYDCGYTYVPDAFSPNNDGHNDFLYAYVHCYSTAEFEIFDRWGSKVFYTNDLSNGWDGKVAGIISENASYTYYLRATLSDGTKISKEGNISVIK